MFHFIKKPSKNQLLNMVLILFLALYLFTPLGFYVKVYVNRILAYNPTPVEEREQQFLSSYHWELKDSENNNFNFEEAKGHVVLLNFWATWCPPCIAEMPGLQELYDDYGDKVTFLFVAQDQEKRVQKFILKKEYTLPVYYEKSTTPKQLFSKSIPSTYLIGKDGKVVVAKTGAADWNSSTSRALIDGLLKD